MYNIVFYEKTGWPKATPFFFDAIIASAKSADDNVILSHHLLNKTPIESFIWDVLHRAQERGADIAKIGVMPHWHTDVLTLLSATNSYRIGS